MKDVYTFADLQSWETVTAGEKPPIRLAVFGDPVAHSASPPMHNAALRASGIDAAYCRLHVHADEFAAALRLLPEKGFIGANVTIPHKGAALRGMNEVDDHARLSGSVNTIRVCEGGQLQGFSTDGLGLERAVNEELGVELNAMRVMVLGAGGGAGQAVSMHCASADVKHLTLVNRTVEKLHPLQDIIAEVYPREQISTAAWTDKDMARALDETDLIINCSSLGMRPDDPSPLPSSLIDKRHLLFDTIYVAERTSLMKAADEAGARSANGLSMLLYQGAVAFEIWFQKQAPVELMRDALFAFARSKR